MFLKIVNASFLPEGLKRWDLALFQKVNDEWHNSFFDYVLPFVREPAVWIPFYIFMAAFILINFKGRGWLWVLFLMITAMVSDYTSSSIIKELFPRLRPCRDPELAHQVRFLVSYCPRSSSFVSSHAVNHFAVSTFIFVTLKKPISRMWGFIFLWAAAICYAQVYVGVHFPVDVMSGCVVGILIGWAVAALYNRLFPLPVQY